MGETAIEDGHAVRRRAQDAALERPWEGDNQDWWDWYLTLAVNETHENAPLVELPEDSTPPLGLARLRAELEEPYVLPAGAAERFRRDGSIKLPQVLSAGAVARLRLDMTRRLDAAFGCGPSGGEAGRFLSLDLVWPEDPVIEALTLSPRIAGIAAALLGVPAVRLYHDNLLSKGPGCGRTPWHYDDHHFPLATDDVVTAWIPAQAVPLPLSPLAFARPLSVHELVEDLPFDENDDSYDRKVGEAFARAGVDVAEEPFAAGDISFHHNLSFHNAGPNRTGTPRLVLANTFFADGARVVERPTLVSGDWQRFMPGVKPGAVADSPLNPVCWPAKRTA